MSNDLLTNDSITYDLIIVGQGICGTFLSWHAYKHGMNVLVIDEAQPFSATKVASGVINPVTGRQVVTTWMAEELMDHSWSAYKSIGNDLGVDVISQKNIIVFPPSQQMRDAYDKRIGEANSYIKEITPADIVKYKELIFSFYGCAAIEPVWLIDLHPLLNGWRKILRREDMLLEEKFEEEYLSIKNNIVGYKNIRAKKLVFCNGTETFTSNYWKNLPYVFNKGEALIVDIPGLPTNNIYKIANSTIVPWYDGLWWVGSSYENTFNDILPTPIFKQKKAQELQQHLQVPFTVVDHIASLRPAVAVERRPFVGFHPLAPQVGILNGMGTKGCSLAPYFAEQLVDNMSDEKPIDTLADIKRFRRILKG